MRLRNSSASRMAPSFRLFGVEELVTIPDHQFDRSTADIHRERRLFCHGHVVFDAQENQPGFFGAADDADGQSRVFGHEIDKVSSVFRLAHGTGGDGDDAIVALVLGQGDEIANDVEPTCDRLVGEAVGRKGAVSESRHVFEAIEDLVACVRLDLSQHHMDGVRSDIDDGNLCHKIVVYYQILTIDIAT